MRVLVASLVAAILLMTWGFVSWTMIGWHEVGVGTMPDEDAVRTVLRDSIPDSGIYFLPQLTLEQYHDEEKAAAWTQKHEEGPVGLLVYYRDGMAAQPPSMFAKGIGINFASALVASVLLTMASIRQYVMRVVFIMLLGVFVGITADMAYANWLRFPFEWSLVNGLDHVAGWLIVGLIVAAIIKPKGEPPFEMGS